MYEKTLLIGWYVTYTPSTYKHTLEPTKKRCCLKNKKHKNPNTAKFCCECGAPIEIVEVPRYAHIPPIHALIGESDEETIKDETFGRGTAADIKKLRQGYAVFPEYMREKDKYILMLPGYVIVSLDADDGVAIPITATNYVFKTDEYNEYVQLAERVFDIQNTSITFGVVTNIR